MLGLGDDRETVLGLPADHSNICKFDSQDGLDYRPVWKYIKRLAERASQKREQEESLKSLEAPSHVPESIPAGMDTIERLKGQ